MILTLINILTLFRIFAAVTIFTLLMLNNYYLLSFILFLISGLTDYLDGYFARKYNASSQIGEILDPIADKILIVFLSSLRLDVSSNFSFFSSISDLKALICFSLY